MVASGTRKARAISAVVSPPRSRSVSATWAPTPSAGWQHVKISRSRSSPMGPVSAGSLLASSRAAWACRSSRDASRRRRSIARLRAVVMIHPAGLGGSPAEGHRSTATVNVSWTASSATPMSPDQAPPRPGRTPRGRHVRSPKRDRSGTALGVTCRGVDERSHLDRNAAQGLGELAAPLERGVEIGRLDDREPADVLLALDVRTVGGEHRPVLHAHDGRRARRMEPTVEDPDAGGLHLLLHGGDVADDAGIQNLWRRRITVGLIDGEQVLLHGGHASPSCSVGK